MKRYLGIDHGLKRIGLALGDDQSKLAMPFKIIENRGTDRSINEIKKIIIDNQIGAIVIGRPCSLKASGALAGQQEQIVLDFGRRLENELNLPIFYQDERLTSRQSQKLLAEQKGRAREDAVAAMLILQAYFDRLI